MRPNLLNPLFADVTSLPGIGPKMAPMLAKVAGPRVVDLVLTMPTGLIDRSYRPLVAEAEPGRLATMRLRIDRHMKPPAGKSLVPWRVLCSDDTGFISLIFFRPKADYLETRLPEGSTRIVSGIVEVYGDSRQMPHPDYIVTEAEADSLPGIEPVYPLTHGLPPRVMRRAVANALARVPALTDWSAEDTSTLPGLPDLPPFGAALALAHRPESRADLSAASPARQRLALDELLSNQLALALLRAARQKRAGRAICPQADDMAAAKSHLPFALTPGQAAALADILADMARPQRMVRLVQGDVGSGKTAIAFLAMAAAASAGVQSALMAPTEILARQHFETLAPLCAQMNLAVVLLTGRDKGQERLAKREGVRKGYVPIVIGTHAIFSDDVPFADLGLVIVDEQHRFGVAQRLALQEKGRGADVLVLTATPIPRTLALTAYGDMEISLIKDKPPGRKPVTTRAVPVQKIEDVIAGLGRIIARGEQAYWVCPLVADQEEIALTSAQTRASELSARFPGKVGLVHGQMPPAEKDAAIEAFYNGTLSILVATTVIEVGVNTPAATLMVIEHAERFGLAQLHQLRGRVGRGDKPSACILLYAAAAGGLGETAKARLEILRETEDGFRIAEEDLRLRGPGDVLGTVQSGQALFRCADLSVHAALLECARADAARIVAEDPELRSPRGEALRVLLYLFGRDDAVKLLRAG